MSCLDGMAVAVGFGDGCEGVVKSSGLDGCNFFCLAELNVCLMIL